MNLIICIDDQYGMQFGGRRQSRDREVCKRVMEISLSSCLWLNRSAQTLFEGLAGSVRTDDTFLQNAGVGEYCFVEDLDFLHYIDRVKQIILFRWNRVYPADTYFPEQLLQSGWKKVAVTDFSGYSHERITQEVYLRED